MSRSIVEADWRIFRELRSIALERFCQRVLDEVASLSTDTRTTAHERYLAIWKVIHQRNTELADAFDNPRRSTALLQLARIRTLQLLTPEELDRFSPETREIVTDLASWCSD